VAIAVNAAMKPLYLALRNASKKMDDASARLVRGLKRFSIL
jgi:hypothetical protein